MPPKARAWVLSRANEPRRERRLLSQGIELGLWGGGLHHAGAGARALVLAHPSHPALGCLRAKLHDTFYTQHRGGGVFAGCHRLDRVATHQEVALGQIWLALALKACVNFHGGGFYPRPVDLRGVLPVRLALH